MQQEAKMSDELVHALQGTSFIKSIEDSTNTHTGCWRSSLNRLERIMCYKLLQIIVHPTWC